jgi:hypothetical protein
MDIPEQNSKKKLVVLHGKDHDNTFMTLNTGKVKSEWYDIIGYVDTNEEGQELITNFTGKSEDYRLAEYMTTQTIDMRKKCDELGMKPLW